MTYGSDSEDNISPNHPCQFIIKYLSCWFCLHDKLGLKPTFTNRIWHICTSPHRVKCCSAKTSLCRSLFQFLSFHSNHFWPSFVLSSVFHRPLFVVFDGWSSAAISNGLCQNTGNEKINLWVQLKQHDVLMSITRMNCVLIWIHLPSMLHWHWFTAHKRYLHVSPCD